MYHIKVWVYVIHILITRILKYSGNSCSHRRRHQRSISKLSVKKTTIDVLSSGKLTNWIHRAAETHTRLICLILRIYKTIWNFITVVVVFLVQRPAFSYSLQIIDVVNISTVTDVKKHLTVHKLSVDIYIAQRYVVGEPQEMTVPSQWPTRPAERMNLVQPNNNNS